MFRSITAFIAITTAATAAKVPLYFEPNLGQANSHVQYLSRANGVTSYLANGAAAFPVGGSSIVMRLDGSTGGRAEAAGRLPGLSSYFGGASHATWHTRVPQFGKVIYRDVYPGIDLVYYGSDGSLEYDFQIAPGADPNVVRLVYEGVSGLRVESGDLLISTPGGQLRQRRPVVYQTIAGRRTIVAASYEVEGTQVRFRLAPYDRTRPLVVDPVIQYASYFGGGGMDAANDVKVDASGNVYIAGSIALPATTANPFVAASASSYDTTAAVIQYSPSQNAILSVAQVGSDGQSWVGRLDVDAAGALYLTGATNSASFPTVNAVSTANLSGSYTPFVAKIAADGQTLVFSTYFGGTGLDQFGSVAAGANGETYVTGTAEALDFPVTDQSVSTSNGWKAYLAKFNADGSLAWSRLIGGAGPTAGTGIALDGSGNIYVTGSTNSVNFPAKNAFQSISPKNPVLASMLNLCSAFAAKFASDGKTLIYATLVGGTGDDAATSAAVDRQGNPYLAGSTTSPDLPVMNAVQDGLRGVKNGFVAEVNPQGNALVFLTYLGGSQKDTVDALALDAAGSIYVAGSSGSSDFPLLNPMQMTTAKASPGALNAFAAKIAPAGRGVIFSTLVGGSGNDDAHGVAADSSGALYLTGVTESADFPVNHAAQASFGGRSDMFLAKIVPDSAPVSNAVVLPASLSFTAVTGGATTAPQAIDLTPAGGGPSGTFTATGTGGNWFSLTPAAGTFPGQVSVSVNPAGLALGTYSGTIQITPGSGASISVPVTLHVIPATPVVTSVTPAEFGTGSTSVTLTISGTGFVKGATAWVTAFTPAYTVSYPTDLVDANTLRLALPVGVNEGPISLSISNPGTPPSNALSLLQGKPIIGAAKVSGTVAPGQIVLIGGINLGPLIPVIAPAGAAPVTTLGPTQVLFDGVPAQVTATYFFQVRAVVPASVAGKTSTKIVVKYFDHASLPLTVATAGNSLPPDPLGPGISGALNSDGSINSAANPTAAGAEVELLVDSSQVPLTSAPSAVTIGGLDAQLVPLPNVVLGYPGKILFRVQIPMDVSSGPAEPVIVQFKNTDDTARLSIAIQ